MHMKEYGNVDRRRQYCFRKCDFVVDGNLEQRLYHTWNCFDPVPRPEAWENIDTKVWFDIKIYDDVSISEYWEVMDKLKQISSNKPVTLHFSNPSHLPLSKTMKNHFWKLINRVYKGQRFYLEFQHKMSPTCQYHVDEVFFKKIIEFSELEEVIKLQLTTSTLDGTVHRYFDKYMIKNY